MKTESLSKIIDVKNQLNDMFAKLCQYLEFIKTDIDTSPENAKKSIDNVVAILKQDMIK